MAETGITYLNPENLRGLALRDEFRAERFIDPSRYWPFLRPCANRVLLVVDGLDYSEGDFGLATFVRTLLDTPGQHVRHVVTLAHIGGAVPSQMMSGESRIARRITNFCFDVDDHFKPDMYDVVMLFGIATSFGDRGTAADGTDYPTDRLADTELRVLTQHMNGGGGLFATGDHASLGRALCHAVPRARGMRLWASTTAQLATDEVSMTGPRRNDTNRLGPSAGSQFDDQSDDVPQHVEPKLYSRRTWLFRTTYPHPLLCGPNGLIRVMPDHPHEGECVEPADTSLALNFGGPLGQEYPAAIDVGARPLPEIISTNSVLSGTVSGGKSATVAQSFGGIGAYDGHRAGIGRVVTEATWHHFVNVNLVGVDGLSPADPKSLGFLASIAGQKHLAEIRAYYRNIVVWASRPERISCMNARLAWSVVWSDRVLEAVLSTPDVKLSALRTHTLWMVGRHARDVFGRYAGQCQTTSLVMIVLQRALPDLIPEIDPWREVERGKFDEILAVDWLDGSPLLDIALGGALVALREEFPQPSPEFADMDSDRLIDVLAKGGEAGVRLAVESLRAQVDLVRERLDRLVGRSGSTAGD